MLVASAQLFHSANPRRAAVRLQAVEPIKGVGWPQLQGMLDELPVFTLANEEGQPLQFKIGEKSLAIFYADVEAAKTQLANAQKQSPDITCDLMPVGLGSAFKLSCESKAMVVPGIAELIAW